MKTCLVIAGDIHGNEVFQKMPAPKFLLHTARPFDCRIHVRPKEWDFLISQDGAEINMRQIDSVFVRRPVPPPTDKSLPVHAQNFLFGERNEILFAIMGLCTIRDGKKLVCLGKQHNLAQNKILQLVLASELGLSIPDTCVTTIPSCALQFFLEHQRNIVYKCLSSPVVEYEDGSRSMIFTSQVTSDDFSAVQHCPSQFQKNVEKQFELRIAVVGTKTISVKIDSQQSQSAQQDWRRNMSDAGMYSIAELPANISEKLISLNRTLGVPWSMVDMVVTRESEYVFLEANPDGAWLWLEDVIANLGITAAICDEIYLNCGSSGQCVQ